MVQDPIMKAPTFGLRTWQISLQAQWNIEEPISHLPKAGARRIHVSFCKYSGYRETLEDEHRSHFGSIVPGRFLNSA